MKRFLRIIRRITIITFLLIVILATVTFFYMRQPQFGKAPSGQRLAVIEKSPHYKNGKFRNLVERPTITEGYTIAGEIYKTLFQKHPRRSPADAIPSVKQDLSSLPIDSNLVVWFGHSSVLIQLARKRILVDPSFSGKASPLPGTIKAYKGSNDYSAGDMPPIDYLLISHDHYDHLDYETVAALKSKVKYVVCGLGVGAHFERWGYDRKQILEKDWFEKVEVDSALTIYTESTQHESGRGFSPGNTLWMSYLIRSPGLKIYVSGDGGYGERFAEIGKKFGPIDWAIMENGQYDKAWQSVHNLPEQVVRATLDLKAEHLLTVHHSKYTLGNHPYDEPLVKITELSSGQPYRLVTPMIGEVVYLNAPFQAFQQWWKNLK